LAIILKQARERIARIRAALNAMEYLCSIVFDATTSAQPTNSCVLFRICAGLQVAPPQQFVQLWSDSMPPNLAQRRAKRAARRKAALQERRTHEAAGASLPEGIRRAAGTPIQQCLLQKELFETGMGMLTLTRGVSTVRVAMGCFLLDVYCLGIKDVMFRSLNASEFEYFIATMKATSPLANIDPSDARKLLRDLALWAESIGFSPHRDFAAVESLFGDVRSDASTATFQFGRDGKPFYIAGPAESPAQIRLRLKHLRERFDNDGFHYIVPVL
jgi:hypothetical protein